MVWWLLALPALWLLILALFAGSARAAWREPVLRHPVLIIESDDWGPGPPSHAQALGRLAELLGGFRDCTGHAPVMTLGLVLTLPDGEAIAASDFSAYRARPITDPAYADVLAAIRSGIGAGVFAPQLHGMAHYWPATLLRAAAADPALRTWLAGGPGLETEALPSHLQSRWVDACVLPSRPLPASEIDPAVAEEVAFYRNVFGESPQVAVPPTFIWTDGVEAAWAAHGVRCVVTPGHRCTGRDADGQPDCDASLIHNGDHGVGDLVYLVRDRYFEPVRGHRAEQGLAALVEKTAHGRPCLLETHRLNFTGADPADAFAQLDRLFRLALDRFPGLRFGSTADLAEQYRERGEWIASSLGERLAAWVPRMQDVPRFAKLAHFTGLGLCLSALENLVRATAP